MAHPMTPTIQAAAREIPFHLTLSAITFGPGKVKGREATAKAAAAKAGEHAGYIIRPSARGDILCHNLGCPYDGQVIDGTRLGEPEIAVILAAARTHIARRARCAGNRHGRIVDKLEVAIPRELSREQEIAVIRQLIWDATGGGRAAALAVRHIDHQRGDREDDTDEGVAHNIHWHIDIYDVGESWVQAQERAWVEGGLRVRQRLGVAQLGDLFREGVLDPPDDEHPGGRPVKTREWLRRCYHAHVWVELDRLGLRGQVVFDHRSFQRRHDEDGEELRIATVHEGPRVRAMRRAGTLRDDDPATARLAGNRQVRQANTVLETERARGAKVLGKARSLQAFARDQAATIGGLSRQRETLLEENLQLRSAIADVLTPLAYTDAELAVILALLASDPAEARRCHSERLQHILTEIRAARDTRTPQDWAAAQAKIADLLKDRELARKSIDHLRRTRDTLTQEVRATQAALSSAARRADQAEAERDGHRLQIDGVALVIAPWERRPSSMRSDSLADRVRRVIDLIGGTSAEAERAARATGYEAGRAEALTQAEPGILQRIRNAVKDATDALLASVNEMGRMLADAYSSRDAALRRAEAAEREREELRVKLQEAGASSPAALEQLKRNYGGVLLLLLQGELHDRQRDRLPGIGEETWNELYRLSKDIRLRERGGVQPLDPRSRSTQARDKGR